MKNNDARRSEPAATVKRPASTAQTPATLSRTQYARQEIARARPDLEEFNWDDFAMGRLADMLQPGDIIDFIGVAGVRFGPPSQPGLYGCSRWPAPPERPPEPSVDERIRAHLHGRKFA